MEIPLRIRRRYTELENYIDTRVFQDKRGWSPNTTKEMYINNICSGMAQLVIYNFNNLERYQDNDYVYINLMPEVKKIMLYLFETKLSIHYEKNIKHGNTVAN